MHVFLQKSPLCRSHFFEWLKTAISSNACGTSTLKSPLLRAFFTPHVHPRPRKRPPRCTLDCGFKTSESPALRGFVAERCPITGTSLYLVLKSNGLRRPKIRLKKFSFSPKIVQRISPKSYRHKFCLKSFFIPFSTSRTNGLRLLSQVKVGTHLGSLRKIAHSGSQGETGVLWMGALSLPSDRFARFGNPAWPGVRTAYFAAFGSWPGGALEERRKPSGQRCAYARRCPEASRPRWAA